MATTKIAPARLTRTLAAVAAEIRQDYVSKGKPVYYAAVPYVDALLVMNTTDLGASYYQDSAATLVRYLLANLSTWRGETAQRVKAELKAALAFHDKQQRGNMHPAYWD